jgi:hypothetical protein
MSSVRIMIVGGRSDQGLGRLAIDDKLEPGRLFDRNIGRLCALEDMVDNFRAVGESSGRETLKPLERLQIDAARFIKWSGKIRYSEGGERPVLDVRSLSASFDII